jgi:hypothetical protein
MVSFHKINVEIKLKQVFQKFLAIVYGNFGLMAFVVQASTHFKQYIHSGSVNFSHGKSKMGTFIGHTSTQVRHPAFVHFNGSLFKPRKLNRVRKAKAAPWGHKYRHQLLGTYTARTKNITIIARRTHKSGCVYEIKASRLA